MLKKCVTTTTAVAAVVHISAHPEGVDAFRLGLTKKKSWFSATKENAGSNVQPQVGVVEAAKKWGLANGVKMNVGLLQQRGEKLNEVWDKGEQLLHKTGDFADSATAVRRWLGVPDQTAGKSMKAWVSKYLEEQDAFELMKLMKTKLVSYWDFDFEFEIPQKPVTEAQIDDLNWLYEAMDTRFKSRSAKERRNVHRGELGGMNETQFVLAAMGYLKDLIPVVPTSPPAAEKKTGGFMGIRWR